MKIKLFFPIIIIQIYLLITVILYEYGLWDFPTIDKVKLYGFIIVYHLTLFIGYVIGINIKVYKNINFSNEEKNIRLLKKILIIFFIILFLSLVRELGLNSLEIKPIINKIIEGIKNPSSGYYSKLNLDGSRVFLGKIGTVIMIIGAPISYLSPILIMIYFKKLNKKYKLLSLVIMLLYIGKFIATGTNKGIFDILIIGISLFLISNQKKFKKYMIILCFLIIALFSFNYILGSRSFGVNFDKNTKIANKISLKEKSELDAFIPKKIKKPLALLTTYLCQGYYGLSLSMEVESSYMLGVGQSLFLVDRISEITDIDKYTLQKKVEKKYGWDSRVQWFTMYSWIANDVGFIGVLFYMFFLGFIFALVYKDVLYNSNVIAKVFFCLLMIQFVFIPANNQLMVNMNSSFSIVFILILWVISKVNLRNWWIKNE